jgi:hypothetical protein
MLEEPEDDENDMLDMAFGLTDTYVASFFIQFLWDEAWDYEKLMSKICSLTGHG